MSDQHVSGHDPPLPDSEVRHRHSTPGGFEQQPAPKKSVLFAQGHDAPEHKHELPGVSHDAYGQGDPDANAAQITQQQPEERPSAKSLHHQRAEKNICVRIFLAIFATRQLAGKQDRELYDKYIFRELIIYIIYLAVLCSLTYGVTNATTFYFTRVIYDLFIDKPFKDTENTFKTSTDMIDFWDFQADILPNLFWNDEPLRLYRDRNSTKGLFYENQLLGVARFRQLRVKSRGCPADPDVYKFVLFECYPEYSKSEEDTGDDDGFWNSSVMPESVEKAWQYQSQKESRAHWGRLATYSGAGAVQPLEKGKTGTEQLVNLLKQNLWIGSSTRAVFLDFTVYNSNINLFCVVRLVWEFSPTGALTTSWSLRTVKLIRYVSWFDNYVVFICEIIFCVFTVYYLIQEIVEVFCVGCKEYFCDPWAWLDIAILSISGVGIAFSFHRYYVVENKLENLILDEDEFHDFEYLGFWQTQFNHALSIAVFLAWIKVFKYISFNKTMTQLSSTLSRCAKDIGGFAIMFFLVFFAFAQLGYLLFGSQVEDYSTIKDSAFTLLRLILGDFDYMELELANRVLGPIFFLFYVFFVFFVLLNMFLAIINDTYGEVKAEIQAQRNEFEISDYIKRGFYNLLGLCGCGKKRNVKLHAESVVKISDSNEEQITYDKLRNHLISNNFSEVEVEMFLARYELDQDRALDEEETQQVLADLEGKKITLERFSDKTNVIAAETDDEALAQQEALYAEEYSNLQDRVTKIETCVTTLQRKMDDLLYRLENE